MAYKSLQHFIKTLEEQGELIRINEYVSPHLEIAEITDRISKSGGKALLFENNGTNFPLLINAFGSEKRMRMALGVSRLDEIGEEMEALFDKVLQPKEKLLDKLMLVPVFINLNSYLPKVLKGRGVCQEVVMDKPDLDRLPVLTCWKQDGGPFITLPVVHTKDPVTGIRNVGMYRMQVFEKSETGMHWHLHKNSARHFDEYKRLGLRMPVSVTLGGDPAYTYAATAPLPDGVDEYLLAGFLRRKKVAMVKCLTNDLEVPADADFVIEGYVDPQEDFALEGPFGDHTGYYSLPDYYPRFHVTCITHRRDAVYPATIVGIPPQEDAWLGKATERIFVKPIKMSMLPEMVDMDMPTEGVFHNIVIVKIKKTYAGQAIKVMNALWGAGQMMFNKVMIVVDGKADVHNYQNIAEIVSQKVNLPADVYFTKGPSDVLDHSSRHFTFGGKMGIDATTKLPGENGKLVAKAENHHFVADKLKAAFPEITAVNENLISDGISVLIVSLLKNKKKQVRTLHNALASSGYLADIHYVIYTDQALDVNRIGDVVWQVANNIDPEDDCFFADAEFCFAIDGTRKTKEWDGFERGWPNVIVADDETIRSVDEKWEKLGLGKFIPSPSLTYKKLLSGDNAVVDE